MKLLSILVAAAVTIYLAMSFAFPTYTHRYRLTVEINTPDGVRSGSSVFEVARGDERWVLIAHGRYTFRVRGEAVFVDLGNGRNVVAVLATGRYGQGADQMISLGIEAYGYYKWDEDAWAGRRPMKGPVELKPPLIPTIVTLSDTTDQNTARVLYATETLGHTGPRRTASVAVDEFGKIFGEGTGLRRVTIQAVPAGFWPLNNYGLSGTPLTKGIENRLPFLQTNRVALRSIIDDMPPRFRPHYHLFLREK